MDYATIEATRHEIHPTGITHTTYKWIGGKHLPVILDCNERVEDLPWKLVPVHNHTDLYYYGKVTYIRKDAYIPYGILFNAKQKIKEVVGLVFYRFIATLNVWNLAYTPQGSVPSWRDIGKKRGY